LKFLIARKIENQKKREAKETTKLSSPLVRSMEAPASVPKIDAVVNPPLGSIHILEPNKKLRISLTILKPPLNVSFKNLRPQIWTNAPQKEGASAWRAIGITSTSFVSYFF